MIPVSREKAPAGSLVRPPLKPPPEGLVLPPVVNRTPPHKRKNKRGKGKGSGGSFQNAIISVPFREVPLSVVQASSGTGGLTNLSGNTSTTAGNTYSIDPFNIGGRLNEFAHLFAHYRFKKLVIKFIPQATQSGVPDEPSGQVTTVPAENRAFGWAIINDPSITAGSYVTVGNIGKFGNTTRTSTLVLKRMPEWLWTSTSAASPTAIDLRMASPAKLVWIYYSTSTTATNNLGLIQYTGVIEFRNPTNDVAAVGSKQFPLMQLVPKEMKSDEDDVDEKYTFVPKSRKK